MHIAVRMLEYKWVFQKKNFQTEHCMKILIYSVFGLAAVECWTRDESPIALSGYSYFVAHCTNGKGNDRGRYSGGIILYFKNKFLKSNTIEKISSSRNSICMKLDKKYFGLVSDVFLSVPYEPQHDKTNKVTVRPAKTQISLGIRQVWSESSLCAQWVAKDPSFLHADSEDWSDWADAQVDLSLHWAHSHFVGFVMSRLIYIPHQVKSVSPENDEIIDKLRNSINVISNKEKIILMGDSNVRTSNMNDFVSLDHVTFKPPHVKTNKMACAPSEHSDQPGHPRRAKTLIRSCGQRRFWSDWADAQADLSLRRAHMPFCWFCH